MGSSPIRGTFCECDGFARQSTKLQEEVRPLYRTLMYVESSPIHSYECLYAQVLQRVKPKIVCEWGPGLNTQMALDSGATVFTIEHNPRYVPKSHDNLVILQIEVKDPLYIHPFNFENVDIFFIDARRRNECMECIAAESKLEAVIVLHDSNRAGRYAKGTNLFPYKIDDGSGTCVLSRSKLW